MDAAKLRLIARLVAGALGAIVAEEATMAALGAPDWALVLLAYLAGALGHRQPGTLPAAT
jgi:hypothetical protein